MRLTYLAKSEIIFDFIGKVPVAQLDRVSDFGTGWLPSIEGQIYGLSDGFTILATYYICAPLMCFHSI